ncbi:hypothetical protein [Agrilutibacter solisilvae]|uniref:Uncharacterized protein n=1 Tax=Agrilutibacter solisilvae TaxID=2763317 RepID=A0A975AQL2_9GAMM|nr:hypothetical protein [Lysobacter solisilvae]QSX77059.1 hypothetical protein I8J32_009580 [Lysobacter solisilvae]
MTAITSLPTFAPGQRWRVRGRHPGEQPTVLIHAIEPHGADDVHALGLCAGGFAAREGSLPDSGTAVFNACPTRADAIVHVSITGITLHNPRVPSPVTQLAHLPLTARAVMESQPCLLHTLGPDTPDAPDTPDPQWPAHHARWRAALASGQASVIDQPVARILAELQHAWWSLDPPTTLEARHWLSAFSA